MASAVDENTFSKAFNEAVAGNPDCDSAIVAFNNDGAELTLSGLKREFDEKSDFGKAFMGFFIDAVNQSGKSVEAEARAFGSTPKTRVPLAVDIDF